MKISKALLGAILAGIAVQTTVTSCSKKEQNQIRPAAEVQASGETQSNPQPGHEPCPGCGMG